MITNYLNSDVVRSLIGPLLCIDIMGHRLFCGDFLPYLIAVWYSLLLHEMHAFVLLQKLKRLKTLYSYIIICSSHYRESVIFVLLTVVSTILSNAR